MRPMHLWILAATCLATASADAAEPAWPTKSVRAIVPVAAGSSTDIVARVVLEQLSAQAGQPIVVENRAGAGGTIGSAFVAKAEADGYTLLAHGAAHTIAQSMYARLSYDPGHDLIAVIPLGISPNVLVVAPGKGFRTVGDLVAAGKARPGTLNFSSVGIGTATHLSAERFLSSAGLRAVHVPFKGGAEAMSEAMAGRVDFFFGPVALVLPQVREGKLLALAVNGARRSVTLPDVPTTLEAGFPDAEYPIWFGLFVPARTPRNVVDRIHGETQRALQEPKMRERLAALGVDPLVMTTDEFEAHVQKEIAMNVTLVKAVGIKPE